MTLWYAKSCQLCLRVPAKAVGECRYQKVGRRIHRFNLNNAKRLSACGKAVRP